MEEMRDILYPLGFLASFGFMLRFALQWLYSEKKRESIVPASFWHISLGSNLAMVLHSIIQVQFFVCIIQATNAVISWRNLNLMQPKERRYPFSTVLWMFGGSLGISVLIFLAQSYLFFGGQMIWMRSPTFFWSPPTPETFPIAWHLFGFTSMCLFASRFWVQWWLAEKNQQSKLGPSFWWLSLTGAICSVLYFLSMFDIVNIIGPGLGMIPYIRNLILLNKAKTVIKDEA